jgi:acetylglutamate kinase
MKTLKIIKIGGHIIDNEGALKEFLSIFAAIEGPKILVHGGGKLATQLANDMQVEVRMVDGRRITDEVTLDIITMVYAGKINKNIVSKLQAHNCNAVGFTGADGNSIVAEKRPVRTIDYGFAGDILRVNTGTLNVLLNHDVVPVFSAISHDGKGQLLNTNADTIASELAIGFAGLYPTELYYCFEKAGVLKDINDETSVITNINTNNYRDLKVQGLIDGGMLPKLDNCFHAIANKVNKVYIGRLEMLSDTSINFTTIQA